MTSKRSLIGVAALFAIAATGACGSDPSAPSTPTPTAGAGGAHAGAGGAPATGGGGASSAGAPAAGAPAAGAPSAGAGGSATAGAGGTGGASGGAGGASGGAGGASGGAGGGSAGASPTVAAVKTLIGMSCGIGGCHKMGSGQLDFQGTTDLYGMLTTVLPDNTAHCKGSTLAVANDANSLLLRITDTGAATTMCNEGGQMKTIARMPEDCSTTSTNPRACLTAAQRKVISDWITAGAPK
jgi:hypothetical protein